MDKLVSIIIPNYNHKRFLKQRLDSVFNQTYKNFEVIILDDASTDGSQELIKKHENHQKVSHVVLNAVNSGSPFKQWQKGIALAQGEYIWIAESDDYSDLHFLDTCLKNLINDVGIVYVQSVDVNSNGEEISHRISYTESFKPNIWKDNFKMKGAAFIENYLLVKNVIPNASAVVFNKEFVKSNYFSQQLLDMKMCGDWFFWLQLASNTNVSFVNQDLNFFRHHEQVSRNHHSVHKKVARLLEESEIRKHIEKEQNIINELKNKQLLTKWFKSHTIRDLFKKQFYALYSTIGKKIALAFQFIYFKIKNL